MSDKKLWYIVRTYVYCIDFTKARSNFINTWEYLLALACSCLFISNCIIFVFLPYQRCIWFIRTYGHLGHQLYFRKNRMTCFLIFLWKELYQYNKRRVGIGIEMRAIFLSSGGFQKNIACTYLCSSDRFFDIARYCWSAVDDFSQSCAMANQCEWVQM